MVEPINTPKGLYHPAQGCRVAATLGYRPHHPSTPTGLCQHCCVNIKEVIMPQSLSSVHIHLVFSTKDREPFLRNGEIRKEMHAYLGGISKKLDCLPVIVGGTEDHVHLLCRLARTITQADWVKEIKRASSIWIKQREPALVKFAWQAGYGTFSISTSAITKTCEYINNQQEHHNKQSFQDEYRTFLRKHAIEWDEQYVWE